jgi:hypothetical protein
MSEYDALQRRLAQGWNTWNTRSVLSHVLLPESVEVSLALQPTGGAYLKRALVGQRGDDREHIRPGPRTYDGRYTELTLEYRGAELSIRSAAAGEELVLLAEPLNEAAAASTLVVESGLPWNAPGTLRRDAGAGALVAETPGRTVTVFAAGRAGETANIDTQTPYLALSLGEAVAISTGRRLGAGAIRGRLDAARAACLAPRQRFAGELADAYAAMQTCLAWDTIYEPDGRRVISPVSRRWNVNWGGWVLFDWDTYFSAWMAAVDAPDLACANAVAITRGVDECGFVPNYLAARGNHSFDRSQPPVGGITVRMLHRRFRRPWLLEETFDRLLTWNRWWPRARQTGGLLCWGSDPHPGRPNQHSRFAAALESGLDNSPMYDDQGFDEAANQMRLQDVGLNSLYVADCDALSELAGALGRGGEAEELRRRAEQFRARMQELLWDEQTGLFLNRRTDTGALDGRLSPTHFYPLLAKAATEAQARRMIAEHFDNAGEFRGEWMLPSIARSDPAYGEQAYWRGRVWAPMNFLVYLGLRNYDLPGARAELAEKSLRLLRKEWREKGHVHENYNADTGEGDDVHSSDAFYHWGGLLGLIALMEAGHFDEAAD